MWKIKNSMRYASRLEIFSQILSLLCRFISEYFPSFVGLVHNPGRKKLPIASRHREFAA